MNFGPLTALSDDQKNLIDVLFACHHRAATANNNLSSSVFAGAYQGSGNPLQAAISALASTGEKHAPVIQARSLIFCTDWVERTVSMLSIGQKIPGYGNSFFKDRIDPSFQPVADLLRGTFEMARIEQVRGLLPHRNQPNAAALTAAVAQHCGLDSPLELWLFIAPRTAAWLSLK